MAHSDSGRVTVSTTMLSFTVGFFDVMIFIFVAHLVENMFFPESHFMDTYGQVGMNNPFYVLYVLFVFFIEFIYYNVIFQGGEIIYRFKDFSKKRLKLAKVIAFTYVCLAIAAIVVAAMQGE